MNYSDNNWRSAPSRTSLFSLQGHEEPSFSTTTNKNNNVANGHLYKTLSKLIDKFDITYNDSNAQEIQRQKDQLLDRYSDIILRYQET